MDVRRGCVEVIAGCMFSGKTEELIRRIRRAGYAGKRVSVFNHTLDGTRYGPGSLNSHSKWELRAYCTSDPREIYRMAKQDRAQLVAIDEGQFFENLLPVCEVLANEDNAHVVVAGLNLDFRGEPFESFAAIWARADETTLLTAICTQCGAEASRTQRLIDGQPAPYSSPRIQVGGSEDYQARCRHCHEVPGKPELTIPDLGCQSTVSRGGIGNKD